MSGILPELRTVKPVLAGKRNPEDNLVEKPERNT
jgi:hypothetical protein|tara:strand:+ start:1178 stop:1279 length:102 start_codon:yes stop_codon:yes gene_type:complete